MNSISRLKVHEQVKLNACFVTMKTRVQFSLCVGGCDLYSEKVVI